MKRIFLLMVAALALTGCATSDYKGYSDIHVERAKTEAMRYKALASVARNSEDATTRALAAMALGIGGSNGSAAPVSAPQNDSLEWGKLLVNGGLGFFGIRADLAKFGIGASRSIGAADKDVIREGMSYGNIINDNTTPAK